jgi:pyridoxal kinase
MGYDIDCINTVSLSNHPAYPKSCKGQGLDADVLSNILQGLKDNYLLDYDVVMSGYTRSIPHLEAIAKAVKKVQEINPFSVYLCDPVLGDNGSYYVPAELKDAYCQLLLPLATVITPNIFECQVLSGIPSITTEVEVLKAAERLHSYGSPIVIMTGIPLGEEEGLLSTIVSIRCKKIIEKNNTNNNNSSNNNSNKNNDKEDHQYDHRIYHIDIEKEKGCNFSGCGDLFSALLVPAIQRLAATTTTTTTAAVNFANGDGNAAVAAVDGNTDRLVIIVAAVVVAVVAIVITVLLLLLCQ